VLEDQAHLQERRRRRRRIRMPVHFPRQEIEGIRLVRVGVRTGSV
jgi:hypothetical protein